LPTAPSANQAGGEAADVGLAVAPDAVPLFFGFLEWVESGFGDSTELEVAAQEAETDFANAVEKAEEAAGETTPPAGDWCPKANTTPTPSPQQTAPQDEPGPGPWKPGDDIYGPTNRGAPPSDKTVVRRFWKNQALNPSRSDYSAEDIKRMRAGMPPQRYNPDKGGIESMEASHEPVPKRNEGTNLVPRWPQEHGQVDPQRRPGY
jgi:filamentous hemagglutinin